MPLFLGATFETLPWKGTTAEVDHKVSEGLHVITARLLYSLGQQRKRTVQWHSILTDSEMRVNTSVTSIVTQTYVFFIWNMEVRLRDTESLRDTEIDDVDLVTMYTSLSK